MFCFGTRCTQNKTFKNTSNEALYKALYIWLEVWVNSCLSNSYNVRLWGTAHIASFVVFCNRKILQISLKMHFNFWQENLYNWRWNIKNVNSMTVLFLWYESTDDWILLQTLIWFYSSPLPLLGMKFGRNCVEGLWRTLILVGFCQYSQTDLNPKRGTYLEKKKEQKG